MIETIEICKCTHRKTSHKNEQGACAVCAEFPDTHNCTNYQHTRTHTCNNQGKWKTTEVIK